MQAYLCNCFLKNKKFNEIDEAWEQIEKNLTITNLLKLISNMNMNHGAGYEINMLKQNLKNEIQKFQL